MRTRMKFLVVSAVVAVASVLPAAEAFARASWS